MKNIAPVFKGRKRTAHATAAAGDAKQAEAKGTAPASLPRIRPTKREEIAAAANLQFLMSRLGHVHTGIEARRLP